MESNSNTGSTPTLKSTDSFIQIDSISIDLPSNNEKDEVASCDHFCIRKYVSEMRQKDNKACWPFESDGGKINASGAPMYMLPPLDVPKFRWWQCQNCLLETFTETEGTIQKSTSCKCKSDSPCTHDLTAAETAKIVTKFKQIVALDMAEIRKDDADVSIQVNGKNSLALRYSNEEEEKDHGNEHLLKVPENGLKDDVHQELSRPHGVLAQVGEVQGQDKNDGVGHPSKHLASTNQHCGTLELVGVGNCAENLHMQIKASHSDRQMNVMGSCEASGAPSAPVNGYHHFEEFERHEDLSSDSTEICPGSRDKSGGLQRRKVRKVRLLTDLLGENGNSNIHQTRTKISPLRTLSAGSEDAGVAEKFKKALHGQKRKRNFPSDEELKQEIVLKKEVQKVEIVKGNARNSETIVKSVLEKDGSVKMSSYNVPKCGLAENRDDPISGVVRKKQKKEKNSQKIEQTFQTKEGELQSKAVPLAVEGSPVENDASARQIAITISKHGDDLGMIERREKKKKKREKIYEEDFHGKVCESRSKAVASGSLTPEADTLLSSDKTSFINLELQVASKSCMCKKKSKGPDMNDYDQLVSQTPSSTCKSRESPIIKTDPGTVQNGSAAVRVISPGDAHLKNGPDASSVGRKCTPHAEYGLTSFTRQEDAPKEDHLLKRIRKTAHVEVDVPSKSGSSDPLRKEVHADQMSKGTSTRIPLMCEKQTYASQFEEGSHFLMSQKETPGVSNNGKIGSQEEAAGMKRHCSEVADASSGQVASDDIPMEIVELMAKIQYENSLHDAGKKVKLNHKKSTVKEKLRQKNVKSGTSVTGKGLCTSKQKVVNYSSHLKTNHTSMSQSGKTHPLKSQGAFSLYQDICGSSPVRPKFSGVIQNVGTCGTCHITQQSEEPVHPWSSAIPGHVSFVNNAPQKRAPPADVDMQSQRPKFLNFNNPNAEKNHKEYHLEQCPRRQNGSKLQNQFRQVDFYSNEKIPAMHLLSLMDAGRHSGQSSSVNGASTKIDKQHPLPHGYRAKVVSQSDYPSALPLNFSGYKTTENLKYASSDYHATDSLPARYEEHSWLLQPDDTFRRGDTQNHNSLKVHEKGKRKLEAPSTQKSLSASPAHSQRNFGSQSNSLSFPQKHTEKKKLNTSASDWPLKRVSETEICTLNRNPADFGIPEPGNVYTIRGNEIKCGLRRIAPPLVIQGNLERETKRRVTAADLLAELQIP